MGGNADAVDGNIHAVRTVASADARSICASVYADAAAVEDYFHSTHSFCATHSFGSIGCGAHLFQNADPGNAVIRFFPHMSPAIRFPDCIFCPQIVRDAPSSRTIPLLQDNSLT